MTTVLAGGLVDVGGGRFERTDISIADGRIVELADTPAATTRIDCSRMLVVPGMVNAHCHSNENWLRGRFDALPLEPWMLYSYPVLSAPGQSAREVYVRTLLGGLEMVRSGATAVVDFLYEAVFSEEALDAVVQAYRDLGLRALVVLGMSDLAYAETVAHDRGLVPAALADDLARAPLVAWPEWEALARSAVARHHRPDEGISIGLGPSGPQRCSDAMLQGCAALAAELQIPIHIHVLETRMQALTGRRRYGCTIPEHLHALGFLGPRVTFEHGIWLTDRDIELVAASATSVVHNPVSNLKLGSGICPVPKLVASGVTVGLGTDGASSNDGNDMAATLKIAALLQRACDADYDAWPRASTAWQMATTGGARALGDDSVGALGPGARADLVLLDLESIPFTPLNDPLNQVVYSSARSAIRSVMVGGAWSLWNSEIVGLDEAAILAEARELAPQVLARHAGAFAIADALVAALRVGWNEARASIHEPARLLGAHHSKQAPSDV